MGKPTCARERAVGEVLRLRLTVGVRHPARLPREPEVARGAPYNRHCHTVFDRARELAKDLGSKVVQPEHIAVAILSIKAGSCYETLKEFSIEPSYVTMLIMESMGFEETEVPDWF